MPRGKLTPSGLKKLAVILKSSVSPNTVVQTWMYHADLVGGLVSRAVGHRRIYWGIRNNHLDPSARKTMLVAKTCAMLSRFVPTGIIACSTSAARYHRELGYQGQLSVIHNGYDLDHLQIDADAATTLRNELSIDNCFTFGFVARWDPIKDHKTLFQAIAIWSKTFRGNYNFILVGTDCTPHNKELNRQLRELSLENTTKLLGQREDIVAIMNMLDVHVLSSKSESFPNVIAESMACGTPCLSTNVGDAAEIIGDTGWLVEPESPQALAKGLQAAHTAFQNSNLPSLACRQRISSKFSSSSMIDAFHSLWGRS